MHAPHKTPLLRFSLCLLLVLGAAACGDDGTGPDNGNDQGEFTATVSGPVNGTFSGYAWQSGTVVDAQTNTQGWVLFLGSQDNPGSVVYVVRLGSRPGSGTYSLVDLSQSSGDLQSGEFAGVVTVSLPGGLTFAGSSSGGSLTITSSSDDRVKGSFQFQITGFDPTTQLEVTASMSGTFDAVSNPFTFPGF
jgi:hypothetical protein